MAIAKRAYRIGQVDALFRRPGAREAGEGYGRPGFLVAPGVGVDRSCHALVAALLAARILLRHHRSAELSLDGRRPRRAPPLSLERGPADRHSGGGRALPDAPIAGRGGCDRAAGAPADRHGRVPPRAQPGARLGPSRARGHAGAPRRRTPPSTVARLGAAAIRFSPGNRFVPSSALGPDPRALPHSLGIERTAQRLGAPQRRRSLRPPVVPPGPDVAVAPARPGHVLRLPAQPADAGGAQGPHRRYVFSRAYV